MKVFRNDFSAAFKETLRGHLNFSVTLYCILWKKFCITVFVNLWKQEGPLAVLLRNVTGLLNQRLSEMGKFFRRLRPTRQSSSEIIVTVTIQSGNLAQPFPSTGDRGGAADEGTEGPGRAWGAQCTRGDICVLFWLQWDAVGGFYAAVSCF